VPASSTPTPSFQTYSPTPSPTLQNFPFCARPASRQQEQKRRWRPYPASRRLRGRVRCQGVLTALHEGSSTLRVERTSNEVRRGHWGWRGRRRVSFVSVLRTVKHQDSRMGRIIANKARRMGEKIQQVFMEPGNALRLGVVASCQAVKLSIT